MRDLISDYNLDLLAISETWIYDADPDAIKNSSAPEDYMILAGLPGVARAFTTLKYYVYPPPTHPGAPPQSLTPPRPAPGRPRPTCKVSALYLENCANALRQKDRQTDRQTILFIDIDFMLVSRLDSVEV